MNDIIIRKATFSDLPNITKLIKELSHSLENTDGIDTNMINENCQYILNNQNYFILLAEINDKIVGLVNFSIRKTLLHSGSSGLIDELIVTRSYRGKGVGKELILAAIENCKQLGCCEVELSTEFSNTAARKLYKKYGFEEEGVFLEKNL